MRIKISEIAMVGMTCLAVSCGGSSSSLLEDKAGNYDTGTIEKKVFSPTEFDLINGTVVDQAKFPASVNIFTPSGGACTATVVGKKVVITASHCTDHRESISFKAGGNSYTATCSRSTLYRRGTDHDIALCNVDREVTGIPYESINMDDSLVQRGTDVLLTGFGCIYPGGSGGNDGKYRIGDSLVTQLPNPGINNYDFVTHDGRNGGALCFGDSGGPAFHTKPDGSRVVISVNSKGNIRDTSYLTSTSTQASKTFIDLWQEAYNLEICGVDAGAENCRDGSQGGGDNGSDDNGSDDNGSDDNGGDDNGGDDIGGDDNGGAPIAPQSNACQIFRSNGGSFGWNLCLFDLPGVGDGLGCKNKFLDMMECVETKSWY